MSQFDEKMAIYEAQLQELNIGYDVEQLKAAAKGLGPSIYNVDSSKVSCSDDDEKARVKANFLIKKLGMADSPALMEAIHAVCEQMGSSNRNKHRPVFYYLLAQKMGVTL